MVATAVGSIAVDVPSASIEEVDAHVVIELSALLLPSPLSVQ